MSEIILSLTVTDLDDFRRYREEEEMTLQELLRRLRREEGPTDAMRAGTALHSILEKPDTDEMRTVERDGHRFHFLADVELRMQPFREIAGRKTYKVTGGLVEVRGKADVLGGLLVEDHKFTTSPFDAERYYSKYQWRAYLSVFGADAFAYNVFAGHLLGTDESGVMDWEIREFHRLPLYRYPQLESDMERELGLYVDFAHRHLLGRTAA